MNISVIEVVLSLLGCAVSGQVMRAPGWNYYNLQSPYSSPLLDGVSYYEEKLCLGELAVTSQRLKETSGIIGHLKRQLNVLEKNNQLTTEKILNGWVWTKNKFDETNEKTTAISKRLDETKSWMSDLLTYVNQFYVSAMNSINTAIGNNSTASIKKPTDIGRMPNNCLDLHTIGHTKSGLYSVAGVQSVETVYCDYSKQVGDPGYQKWIGYVDVKSMPTFFHVQKNIDFSSVGQSIPFEVEIVNTGRGMDVKTGKFTTSISGIYQFSFVGLVRFELESSDNFELRLCLNGNRIASSYSTKSNAWSSVTSPFKFNQISLQMTMKLQEFDQIWLEIHSRGAGASLHDDADWHHTHFTGLLVEGDFEQVQIQESFHF